MSPASIWRFSLDRPVLRGCRSGVFGGGSAPIVGAHYTNAAEEAHGPGRHCWFGDFGRGKMGLGCWVPQSSGEAELRPGPSLQVAQALQPRALVF